MLFYHGFFGAPGVNAKFINDFSCSTMMVNRELPVRPSESMSKVTIFALLFKVSITDGPEVKPVICHIQEQEYGMAITEEV